MSSLACNIDGRLQTSAVCRIAGLYLHPQQAFKMAAWAPSSAVRQEACLC